MKAKKLLVALAATALVASFGLFGCSGGDNADAPEAAAGDYTTLTEGTLVALSSPDYPPFENLEGEEVVGFEVDLLQAICDKLGLTLEISPLQFDAIIPAIVSGGQGDVGLSGFTITPEREKEVDFTDSYYVDDQAIAVMQGSPITADNVDTALNDASITIAAQSGTSGFSLAQELFPNANVVGYGSNNDAFAAMQAGQADAAMTNSAVVEKMLEAYTDAVIVKEIATGEEYGIAVSQDNPGLTAAINAALAELKADGTIDALYEKWF